MKGAVLALFCAVALASAEINENGCPINPYVDVLKPHPNCNKFYQCLQGDLFERVCASTLVFNVETQECDWPENVDCDNRSPPVPVSSEENEDTGNGNGNDDPSLAPEICAAEDSDGILVAHEACNKFYQCHNGVPVTFACAPVNLMFNPSTGACDWPENVDCGNRIPGGDGDSDNGGGDNGDGGNGGGNGDGNGDNGNGEDNDNSGNGSGNNDPSLAPEICAAEDSDGILVAHEICNKFYQCHNGVPVERRCAPESLVFNPSTDACDWPENVDCGNRIPGGDSDSDNGGGDNGDGGNGGGNGDGNGDNGNGEDNDNSGNGSGNNDPSLAPKICAAEDSDGILVAHEICNKFYQCHNGVPVVRRCAPESLVFNPSTDACDWPENVDCGNRIPGGDSDSDNGGGDNGDGGNGGGNGDGNGDNGNGEDNDNSGNGSGNNDPSLAPEICAAEDSDGILVAHEICNKFYQCHNGVPVERRCAPESLVFNPSTDACDWPENVDCGNRIPGGDSDSDNGGGDNGDGGNGGGNGDGNGDNGNGEDNDNSGNGSGNNDPSLAPEICAAEDSDSILVAHEICNKFYQCHNGVPVERRCAPESLVFNPSTDACDWPENVDCGNRIPGGDGDSDNGGGDNGDGGNGGGNGDGNGDNGNGEDNDNSGNGSGNNDPSLAPEICAAEDSDGILVAHEICNKFYQCHNGVPVERRCAPESLVFNPSTDACDWPENVDCGNRIPGGDSDSDNGGGDNGDGGNGGGNGDGNGDNGNGEDNDNSGNGSGNNDPSLAPEICAAEDSDGILVAHEICNKFYQCHNGVPVERRCAPESLVFNPSTDACDWPENVDCGNRIPGGDGDSDNGGGDNGDGGNGGGNGDGNEDNGNGEDNDNSGNGSGNNDPSLAPEICAAEDSDGILVAHEICNKFYQCHNGVPVERRCAPESLVFNPSTDACDWPENVDCGNRIPGGDSDSDNGGGDNGDGGNGGGNGDGNGDNGNGEDNDNSGNGSGNNDPSLAPEICAGEHSDGVLVAHEICNKFYQCHNGVPVERRCAPESLVFNPSTDACDWPENVDCGNRIPGGDSDSDNGGGDNGDGGNGGGNGDGNGDNGNGEDNDNSGNGSGNNDPSLAPEICAAEDSDGILVAHENCNQFYVCSEGKPVVLSCPRNLLFNPSNAQCDWPENVKCDGRDTDGGNGGNGDNGNGDGDNGNNAGGGNANPSEAPEICAAEGSDGVLVAHENCNQFYKCSEGRPVVLNCPLNLLFNPNKNQCDWPENVNCDGRNPDGDNGGNGDGGNGDGENGESGSGGNSDPSEARKICAAEGSDGILVAHENCNQFYVCSEGSPVALDCPLNLLFNPTNDQCDWPENVDCGNRHRFTSFNKHMRYYRF